MLLRLVVGAIATAAAVWLIPGIRVVAETDQQYILIMLGVAAIMGVVNAVIKPFTQVLSFCLVVVTFGLFLLVINASMLALMTSRNRPKVTTTRQNDSTCVNGLMTALTTPMMAATPSMIRMYCWSVSATTRIPGMSQTAAAVAIAPTTSLRSILMHPRYLFTAPSLGR